MPKVSVIVPVYNAGKYIDKCFQSIAAQTFKDIEIILVDDGSTDNTANILETYVQKDPRVLVIKQANAKQGAARNTGLQYAKGKFITFVDSDDWIDLDYIEKLYNAIVENNANIAIPTIIRELANGSRKMLDFSEKKFVKGANEVLKAINWELVSHSKIYRFNAIKNLRFQEQVFYEDAPYTLKAINVLQNAVLVPDVAYHYFSRADSTIKGKQTEAHRNDIIETQLDLITYANKNNLILKNNLVCKDSNFIFKTKHFVDKKEYYVFGLKIATTREKFNFNKTFVIFQLQCFGDNLCCNSLVQNIKMMFPNSKIIMVVDKPWVDVARYQKDVDEVIVFDKRGKHRGVLGILKFVLNFPYKHIDYIMQLTKNERIWLSAKLLRPRKHFIENENIPNIKIINRHCEILKQISHKNIIEYPIIYNASNDIPEKFTNTLYKNKKYVALCTTTKLKEKDLPVEKAYQLIKIFNTKQEYEVLLVGAGKSALLQANKLKEYNCEFIDLVNKTTIVELAQILRNCEGVISVDTGTMHFAYANNVPVLCLFNLEESIPYWAPNEQIYKAKTITSNINSDSIYQKFKSLIST